MPKRLPLQSSFHVSALARITFIACAIVGVAFSRFQLEAATVVTTITDADAFLCTGSTGNPTIISTTQFPNATDSQDLTSCNFGGAGTLAVSAASSTKGEFQSVIRFNMASTVAQFNSTYGAGNWTITSIQLKFLTNYGVPGAQPNNAIFNTISAGNFGITWLGNDNWAEGTGNPSAPTSDGVTYDDLTTLKSDGTENLGIYTYSPPGNDVPFYYTLPLSANNLTDDIKSGSELSLLFYAADDQVGMLFNSRSKLGYEPDIVITADIVPEPSPFALLSLTLVGGWMFRRNRLISC